MKLNTAASQRKLGSLEPFAGKYQLPAEYLQEHGLFVVGEGKWEGWLAIPYPHMTGTWQYRFKRPDHITWGGKVMSEDKGTHLYNPLRLGPHEDEVWLCEGEIDTLTLAFHDLPAIGLPGAQSLKPLAPILHRLYEDVRWVIATDNDPAGNEVYDIFAAEPFRVERFPVPDGQDISDMHVEGVLKDAIVAFNAR